jgi:hypothetical protein
MTNSPEFKVIETFEITGRGVVAVIDETVDLGVGKELRVVTTRPNGTLLEAHAYQEWLLRRQPTPVERAALLLVDIAKSEVPNGSSIRVTKNNAF